MDTATATATTTEASEAKSDKVRYPVPAGGLDSVPEDYLASPSKFETLKKDDFSSPVIYWEWQKRICEEKIEALDRRIDNHRRFGGNTEAAKAVAQIENALKRVSKLQESLKGLVGADAMSLEDLFASLTKRES